MVQGIAPQTVADVLDYAVRVSSREAYVSPTRGAQGNALKTLKGLAARALAASAVPSEMRHENFDGPGPAATFAGSLAAFRKKYFGEE